MPDELLIDLGNTRLKWAWRGDGGGRKSPAARDHRGDFLPCFDQALAALERPRRIRVSNVAGDEAAHVLRSWCLDHWSIAPEFARVTETACGVRNAYLDCTQLGVDRWLALCAAWHDCRQACCVVDLGTALTVDLLDAAGSHLGGWIIPGPALMAGALGAGTAAVRRVTQLPRGDFGRDTAGCVDAGLAAVMRGAMREMLELRPAGAPVYLTGGAGETLRDSLPADSRFRPGLVLDGLALDCVDLSPATGSP